MLRDCYNKVPLCVDALTGETLPDPDSPFRNLSSEAPDVEEFKTKVFGHGNEDDPLRFMTPGCLSLCISTESQADADACAARQALLCSNPPVGPWVPPGPTDDPDPWQPPGPGGGGSNPGSPGGGGPKGPNDPGSHDPPNGHPPPGGGNTVKYNTEQSCSVTCPDGSTFTKTVAAGQDVALTQAMADAKAHEAACAQAAAAKICLGELPANLENICTWEDVTGSLYVTGLNAPYTVTVDSGELPPGIDMASLEGGTGVMIGGAATSGGTYNFTLKAEDGLGNSNTKDYTMRVRGITQQPGDITDGLINQPYTYQFMETGPFTEPIAWAASGLPAGLTIDYSSGLVSGTPTEHGAFLVSVVVTDQQGYTCSGVYNLYIWDCSVDTFTAEQVWTLACGGPTDESWPIPPAFCERTVHIYMPETIVTKCKGAACSGSDPVGDSFIVVTVYDPSGSTVATGIAATMAPFGGTINITVIIPAQTDPDAVSYRIRIQTYTVPQNQPCNGGTYQLKAEGL